MSKYIDLQDALDEIAYAHYDYNKLIELIKVLPTIDIVQCKDCTHYHACKDYAYCTAINVKGKAPQPTDFCSYGQKK